MSITVVLDNIRSAYNVGSIARTCDGLGVERVIAYGITPYPLLEDDTRLPHISRRASAAIRKTALGAESLIRSHVATLKELNHMLGDTPLICLEQTTNSIPLKQFSFASDIALVLGSEVDGVSQDLLDTSAQHIEIPMHGKKESFNVAVAGAIALYELINR